MSESTILAVEAVEEIKGCAIVTARQSPLTRACVELCDSHEALRAEVERLTRERDNANAQISFMLETIGAITGVPLEQPSDVGYQVLGLKQAADLFFEQKAALAAKTAECEDWRNQRHTLEAELFGILFAAAGKDDADVVDLARLLAAERDALQARVKELEDSAVDVVDLNASIRRLQARIDKSADAPPEGAKT